MAARQSEDHKEDHQPITSPRKLNSVFFDSSDNFGGPALTDSSLHEEAINAEEHMYPHPKDFQPLFGLIDDELSGEQHHPHIHYIFTDDDDDLVTNAAIHALEAKTSPIKPGCLSKSSTASNDQSSTDTERFILLDLDPTGSNVVSAQSLSPDWQILSTELSLAPSFQDNSNAIDGGMMLRVRGVESSTRMIGAVELNATEVLDQARTQTNDHMTDAMSNLADRFQHELDITKRMMTQWDES